MTTPAPHDNDVVTRLFRSLDSLVDQFHDRVMRPLIIAGRTVAFGFILLITAIVVAVALLVVLTRLFNVYVFEQRVWATYLVLGALFVTGGLVVWRRRGPVRTGK